MICTKCNSQMYHQDGYDDFWCEEDQTYDSYYWARWDCLNCGHGVANWEDEYEGVE